MAAIAAAAALMARRAGRTAGLLTAVLLAAAPFHVRYSQELRPYSLALLLLCASLLCLDRWLERGRLADLALLYLACLATAYTLYLAAFVLPLAAAGLLAEDSLRPGAERRRRARRFLLWSPIFAGALLLGYLPWCPVVLDVLRRPPLTAAVPVTVAWVGRILSFLSLAPDETTGLTLPAFGYVLLAVIGLAVCARTPTLRFLVVWAVGGLAGIEILSQIHPHFDAARRFLPAGLALTLGAAVGLARIARMRGGRAAATLLVAAILLADGRALSIYFRSGRPDWRLLAAALQTRLTPGQQIFSSNPWTQLCLGFYLRPHDRGRRPGPGDLSVVNVDGDAGRLEGAWRTGTAAWLVLAGEPRCESLRRWAARFPVFSVPEADGAEVRRLEPGLRRGTQPDSRSRGLAKAAFPFYDRHVEPELSFALDDLILGRGVARGRHSMKHQGRVVRKEMEQRLSANGFRLMTVREAEIVAGERLPAFYLHDDLADFGYIRWEIFTPRSRRKLFASEHRRPDNDEWTVQLNLSSSEKVWANPDLKERHDVDTVVAVNP